MAEPADRTFAIFGVVIIVLAAGFIVIHDDVSSEAARYNRQISFPMDDHDEGESGNLNQGDSDVYEYDWQIMNITTIVFVLTWNDNDLSGLDDTFSLAYEGPDGQSGNGQDSSGTITLTETIMEVPDAFRMDRTTEAAAQAAADEMSSTVGMGNWSVTVTLQNAPPGFTDGSNSYDLEITVNYFEANLAEITDTGPAL